MLIKRACATTCGISKSGSLFLELTAVFHVVSHSFMDGWDILTDGDGNKDVGESGRFISMFYT